MKILDRYLLVEFLKRFVGILVVLTSVLLLREVLRDLADMLVHEPPPHAVLLYFVYYVAGDVLFVVPTTAILAMMFSLGMMAKHKEVLAIHACGVSYARIGLPLGLAVAAITLGAYATSETVVPACLERARYVKAVLIKGREESVLSRNRNITTKGKGNRFYSMRNFDSRTNTMQLPTITQLTTSGHSLALRIDAASAQLVERDAEGELRPVIGGSGGRHYQWLFTDAVWREFDRDGNVRTARHYTSATIPMEGNLDRFLATDRKPNQMNLFELLDWCRTEALRGDTAYYRGLRLKLHNRLALPFATFLLGMLGYTFAVRSSIRSLVFEFGLALASVVAYYALFAFWERAGENGWAPPLVTAWTTNLLFLILLVWRVRALERVPSV